jgi:crotonobetainyl-CoA:carnitine CoA-transferase CaiB-like acyl-CoA transferase
MSENNLKHVLDGYRVLDFSQVVAGPTATLMLAEMGADVIKVELPPAGDPARLGGVLVDGRSGYFVQHNRGKKDICVDVKHPDGLAIVKGLLPQIDVVVQNYAPGVIQRLGLDYETIKAINPKIVMCSISAFGQSGPLANEPGFDYLGAAYAGITSMGGEPDGPPQIPMIAIGDVSTGAHAMGAICAALLYRERTGRGQHLDISLLDTYAHYHEAGVQMNSVSKGKINPTRSGAHSWYAVPCGVFRGNKRDFVIIAALQHHFANLCKAMGKRQLAQDPRFVTNGDRLKNLKELVGEIESWLQAQPNDEAVMAAIREFRVPCAPILSVAEARQHPHLRQRGTIRTVHDRILGDFDVPGFALRFSEFPDRLTLEAPMLGEHNEQVLTKMLGYSAEAVHDLEQRGVLHNAPH